MLVKLYGNAGNRNHLSAATARLSALGGVPRSSAASRTRRTSARALWSLNWTTRTTMRGYTRLSNGFSRKIENHMAAVAVNYFAHNLMKIHSSLPVTPAMEAGVTRRPYDVMDLVNLLIASEKKAA